MSVDECNTLVHTLKAIGLETTARQLHRAMLDVAGSSKRTPGRGRAYRLTGHRLGIFIVGEQFEKGGPTPRWRVTCTSCHHEDIHNGSQLRNNPPACRRCKKRKLKPTARDLPRL